MKLIALNNIISDKFNKKEAKKISETVRNATSTVYQIFLVNDMIRRKIKQIMPCTKSNDSF